MRGDKVDITGFKGVGKHGGKVQRQDGVTAISPDNATQLIFYATMTAREVITYSKN